MAIVTQDEVPWPAILEETLVELWAERPCLFNITCPEYADRTKKEAAIQEIAVATGKTEDDVKKKIKGLRNSYNRAKKTPSTGSSMKPTSKRVDWLKSNLDFLNATKVLETTSNLEISNDDAEDILDDHQNENNQEEAAEIQQGVKRQTMSRISETGKAKRKRDDEEMELLKLLASSVKKDLEEKTEAKNCVVDCCTTFGTHVSESLRQLNFQSRSIAMNEIQSILTRAMLGQLGAPNMMGDAQCHQW